MQQVIAVYPRDFCASLDSADSAMSLAILESLLVPLGKVVRHPR